MNKLGLKEPGWENQRTFSKKAREPQKLLRFKKSRLSTFPNHGQLNNAWVQNSLKIFDDSEKAISTIKASKIEQSFQIFSEFKLNEGIALSFKLALLFWKRKRFFMSQSGLVINGQAQASLLFALY